MNAWPLILAVAVMGLGASLHCVAMCALPQQAAWRGIPIVAEQPPPGPRQPAVVASGWLAFQAGRISGYGMLGAVAGLLGEGVIAAARWQPIFESVWAMLNAGMLLLGAAMLALGREPGWALRLTTLLPVLPVKRRSTAFFRGAGWALLPCGPLYGAVAIAVLAGSPLTAVAVMVTFAVATTIGLAVLEATRTALRYRVADRAAYRLQGLLLAVAASAGLVAAIAGLPPPFCG